jgi:hypothetical protein
MFHENFQFHFGIPMKIYVQKKIMNPSVFFSHLIDFSFQITKEKKKFLKEGGRGEGKVFTIF